MIAFCLGGKLCLRWNYNSTFEWSVNADHTFLDLLKPGVSLKTTWWTERAHSPPLIKPT